MGCCDSVGDGPVVDVICCAGFSTESNVQPVMISSVIMINFGLIKQCVFMKIVTFL